jgi:hypothetical protein
VRKARYTARLRAALARRQPPLTARFVEWPPADRIDELKATAKNYRDLAEITGRPVKRALFIQYAEKREARIAELEEQQRRRYPC